MATGYIDLLPGSATFPDGSSGNVAALLARKQGTEANPKKHFLVLQYGALTALEHAWWTFRLPDDYASGGTLKILWIGNATANSVVWQARVGAITPNDADTPIEHAQAAAATVTTAINATEAYRLNESSITLTMDSAAAGDLIFLCIFRDTAHASDTLTVGAELIVATFSYTTT